MLYILGSTLSIYVSQKLCFQKKHSMLGLLGKASKTLIFIILVPDPTPPTPKSVKNVFYFLDTRPFLTFLTKMMFFGPRKAEN